MSNVAVADIAFYPTGCMPIVPTSRCFSRRRLATSFAAAATNCCQIAGWSSNLGSAGLCRGYRFCLILWKLLYSCRPCRPYLQQLLHRWQSAGPFAHAFVGPLRRIDLQLGLLVIEDLLLDAGRLLELMTMMLLQPLRWPCEPHLGWLFAKRWEVEASMVIDPVPQHSLGPAAFEGCPTGRPEPLVLASRLASHSFAPSLRCCTCATRCPATLPIGEVAYGMPPC